MYERKFQKEIKVKVSLKAARINANLLQKDIAKRLNVSEATVCRWERGTITIPNEFLEKYCEICNIDKTLIKETN